jgi:hypothetical protein
MDKDLIDENNQFIKDAIPFTGIPEKYGVISCYQLVQTSFPALLAKL